VKQGQDDGREMTIRAMMAGAMATIDGKGNGNSSNSEQGMQAARAQHVDARQREQRHGTVALALPATVASQQVGESMLTIMVVLQQVHSSLFFEKIKNNNQPAGYSKQYSSGWHWQQCV